MSVMEADVQGGAASPSLSADPSIHTHIMHTYTEVGREGGEEKERLI